MATIPITKRGAELLKAELHRLKTVVQNCRTAYPRAIAPGSAFGPVGWSTSAGG